MIENNRILLVDDNRDIHEDFRKVLCGTTSVDNGDLDDLELGLFGDASSPIPAPGNHTKYEVDSAYQGEEALEKVRKAHAEGRPYAMAFMDNGMDPSHFKRGLIRARMEVVTHHQRSRRSPP